MESSSRSKSLHIGIALAVLSHKPSEQTLSSYLIDFKTWFPLAPATNTSQLASHTDQRVPDEADPWRKRALELEDENELLKLRAQKQELELLALKSTSTPMEAREVNVEIHSSQPPKKKRKTGPKVLSDRLDLQTLIGDFRSGPGLPALKDSLDVLNSLCIIQQSDMSDVKTAVAADDNDILIRNIKRSLVGLGNLLAAVLNHESSVVATSSRVDVTSSLCDLLVSLLNSTLPLRPRHAILPHVLDELALRIVRPIIRSFYSISVYEFTSGLKETRGKSATMMPDIRPDILSILKRLLTCLRTLKARTRELREFMVFETVKEIEELWTAVEKDGQQSTTLVQTRECRLRKLARKDSLWYHCSVLHVALDQLPSPTCDGNDRSLLSSVAVQALAGLMQLFESRMPVDAVARGMMLAVVEKAWLGGLYDPSTEETGQYEGGQCSRLNQKGAGCDVESYML